jgi:hypothetical protein
MRGIIKNANRIFQIPGYLRPTRQYGKIFPLKELSPPNVSTEVRERPAQTPVRSPANPEAEQNLRIGRYELLALQIENRIKETNETKKAETGMVAGIGDWIGEHTGAYETGKAAYVRTLQQAAGSASSLSEKIAREFGDGSGLPDAERMRVALLLVRLDVLSKSQLEDVSWTEAFMTSTGAKDSALGLYPIHRAMGMAEGAFGVIESTGKTLGTAAAFFNPETHLAVMEDVNAFARNFDPANLKKVGSSIPAILAALWKLPLNKQVEGLSKFAGSMAVPGGILSKTVRGGKIMEGAIVAANVERAEIASVEAAAAIGKASEKLSSWDRLTLLMRQDILRETAHKGSVPAEQFKMAKAAIEKWDEAIAKADPIERKQAMEKVRMTFEKAWVQEATKNHSAQTAAEKAIKKAQEKAKQEAKIAKTEARSGVSREEVYATAQMTPAERLAKAEEKLGKGLTESEREAILKAHETGAGGAYQYSRKELLEKSEILKEAGFSHAERRKLMETSVTGGLPLRKVEEAFIADTLSVPKLRAMEQRQVGRVVLHEMEKVGDESSNLRSLGNRLLQTADESTREKLHEAGNAWMEARLGNIANFLEYAEEMPRITEGNVAITRHFMRTQLEDHGLRPVFAQLREARKQGFVATDRNQAIMSLLSHRLQQFQP